MCNNIFNEVNDIFEMTDGVIRKEGNKWCIFSKTGKKLQCFDTKKDAEIRLKQIEMFKYMNQNKKHKKEEKK
jgi:hypothetical protein